MIGISEELTVIRPGGALSPRCAGVLEAALAGRQAEVLSRLEGPLTGRRLLFVVSLDEGGVNRGFYDLLAHLRTHPNCLDRCVGSVLVDAPGDLYTKAAGRDLVLAANLAGCAFVGRPLVEGTGDLRNFTVQARNAGCSLEAAYHLATADLVERVLMDNGYVQTAKSYILYREERSRAREMNTRLMKTYEDLTFQSAKDNDIKRENANIDGDTPMGTMLKYGSEGAKHFYESYVLNPAHSEAHRNGDIHIHDLDFYTLTTTCCQIDLIKLANQVETMVEDYPLDIKVAVMGCVVNGPGEAKEADLGIAGGIGEGLLIKHGEIIRKVPENQLLDALREELEHWN